MNLIYLVFGNKRSIFLQCWLSILSFLKSFIGNDKVIVLTDKPEKFNFFGSRVEVIEVNQDKLKEWRGSHNFFWRVKIEALLFVSKKYPNTDLLFVDSDTFLMRGLDKIKAKLKEGNNFMHLREGEICSSKSKTQTKMWKQMKGKSYDGVLIDTKSDMWNAGVIAVSHKNLDCLTKALALCDAICADNVIPKLIEQFSFSLALQQGAQLLPAENYIKHYWGNKPYFVQFMNAVILDNAMENKSIDDLIKVIDFNKLSNASISGQREESRGYRKYFSRSDVPLTIDDF